MADRYCKKCGSKCIRTVKKAGHDQKTGKNIYDVYYKCPKYSIPFGMGHDNYSYGEDPNFGDSSHITKDELDKY